MLRLEQALTQSDVPVSRRGTLVFVVATLGVMALAFMLRLEYPLFLAVCGLFGAFLVWQHPVVWITVSILLFLPVFWNIQEGLTPGEILHTMVYYGGLLWWFFHRLIVARERIRWSAGGILLALLLLQMLLLGPVSIGINADPYVWLREIVILSTPLLLIPISHECTTRPRQYSIGAATVLVLTALSLKNIYQYKQKVVEAVWVWQVGASRASESFFLIFALAVIGLAVLLSMRRPLSTLISAAVVTAGVAATVLSFYRTIWVAALVGYVLMGLMLGGLFWKRALGYLAIVIVVAGISYPLFLADVVPLDVMWTSVSSRFTSIGKYRQDLSVTNRDAEAQTILDDVEGHWLLGKGIAVTTPFRKLTSKTTIYPTWTHNGYAWVLKHYGVIGTLLLFSAWLYYAFIGLQIARRFGKTRNRSDEDVVRVRLLAAAGSAVILSTFLVSITINQFLSHESGFIFAVVFGLFEVWYREEKSVTAGGQI
ncbi:MAG: hypothetical protein M5R41_12520 [Bacteroidia bacterium]|nr:hypothetical protein [Bacteroidia bacterium]